MADPVPPGGRRLGRRWARLAAVPVVAGLVALLAAEALLLDEPAPRPRPLPPASAAPLRSQLPSSAPPPPGRPERDPALELPPLAAAWRAAIVENRRAEVLELVGALRDAPDGQAQLLRLTKDGHERVRAYALTELGRRRDPSLREVFVLAQGDPSPHVRESAAHGLALLGR